MDFYAVSPRLRIPDSFLRAFEQTLHLAEAHGFRGILLFDGSSVAFSPWVLAQHILTRTASLLPLIAAGPAYVAAKDAARLIANLHRLYGRPVALNLVAGAETRTGAHSDQHVAADKRVTKSACVYGVQNAKSRLYRMRTLRSALLAIAAITCGWREASADTMKVPASCCWVSVVSPARLDRLSFRSLA